METKHILYIIIGLIILIYISAFTYVMIAYVAPMVRRRSENNSSTQSSNQFSNQIPIASPSCDMNSPQTKFFKDSVDKAEKVLKGNVFLDGYKYGGAMDLTKLNDSTKEQIITSMRYMMIDPIGARNIEQQFRLIVEQENVPLYFVILHEGIKKLMPIENNPSITQISNEALMAEIERRNLNQDNSNERGNIVSINQKVA